MIVKPKFYIRFYDEYCVIQKVRNYKSIELGWYPVKDFGYAQYFILYYKGRKPTFKQIKESLFEMIVFSDITHKYLKECIKDSLKQNVRSK